MDLISKTSGISKNTLYSHFSNKQSLFSSVIQAHWSDEKKPSIDVNSSKNLTETLTVFATDLIPYLYKDETICFFRLLVFESHTFSELASSIMDDDVSPSTFQLTQYFMKVLKKDKNDSHQLALKFLGLLKEDAFWHVLVGFRKKYTSAEVKDHIDSCVHAFMKLI
jgi:TetR/AcrR family transcriptional regulator, mexJK operon transcriptional repressor